MWRERLHQLLIAFGMKALLSDRSTYGLWRQQGDRHKLVPILSTHVDDIKGGAEVWVRDQLMKDLDDALKSLVCTKKAIKVAYEALYSEGRRSVIRRFRENYPWGFATDGEELHG